MGTCSNKFPVMESLKIIVSLWFYDFLVTFSKFSTSHISHFGHCLLKDFHYPAVRSKSRPIGRWNDWVRISKCIHKIQQQYTLIYCFVWYLHLHVFPADSSYDFRYRKGYDDILLSIDFQRWFLFSSCPAGLKMFWFFLTLCTIALLIYNDY